MTIKKWTPKEEVMDSINAYGPVGMMTLRMKVKEQCQTTWKNDYELSGVITDAVNALLSEGRIELYDWLGDNDEVTFITK